MRESFAATPVSQYQLEAFKLRTVFVATPVAAPVPLRIDLVLVTGRSFGHGNAEAFEPLGGT
jgi:hypothetical protein